MTDTSGLLVGAPSRRRVRLAYAHRRTFDLLVAIVRRDLVLRYRRSALGVLWGQLAPLALLGVLNFVFSHVAPLGIPHYPAYLFVGILLWNWFQGSLTSSAESVVHAGDLVRQPGFPLWLLPVAAITGQLMQFVLALPVLVATIVVATGRLPFTAVAAPLVLAVQFAVLTPLALVLAAANVRYRDVAHLTGVVLLLLFYATPVVYALHAVPARYRVLFALNPLTHLLSAARACLLDGHWPNPAPLAVLAVVAAVATVVAARVFTRMAHAFSEEL